MIARSFVAQGAVDQDELGGRSVVGDLAGGRDADEQPTAGGKKLLSYEHRKRGACRAADNAHLSDTVEVEDQKVGMVAGPPPMGTSGTGPLEVPHDVAVGIEHTHWRNGDNW